MDKCLELVTTADGWYSQFIAFLVTTGSVYVVEMSIFLTGLAFYHFCIFVPRVRRKIYKEPTKEASRSLMRISGMLPSIGEVEKTQIDEEDEDRDEATQNEMEGAEALLAEVHKKRKKLQPSTLQAASTPPSSIVGDDDTTPSATTPSTFVPPKKSLPKKSRKKSDVVEKTQLSSLIKGNQFALDKQYVVRSLRLSSRSEKPTPDNPPNSDQYII